MSGLAEGHRRRLLVVSAVLALALALVALKAGRLQLVLGDDLKDLAERQYVRDLRFSAPRGNIYDAAGRPLAISVPVWSVAAEPRRIDDPRALAHKLAPILEQDVDALHEKLAKDRGFVWLKRRVAPEVADAVRALGEKTLSLHKESRRFYPNKELAGQVLGLVNIDGDGQSGVEKSYDEHLRGRTIALPGLRDNHGQKVALSPGVDLDVLAGDDVFLTIDSRLQHVAETALLEAVIANEAKSGFAIVVEPDTGAIRALANAPLFNPNAPSEAPVEHRRNHAISDTFEPGSTFKTVTFASALENDVVKPSERIFCENGRYQVGRFTIRDAHPESWLTVRDVFKHSSNIGTLKIALRVGEERFKETIDAFAFGRRIDIGLSEEASGLVPSSSKRWGDVRTSTVSYGHGVTVTGLQLAQMTAIVANGGVRVPLRLVERVQASTGEIVDEQRSDDGERVLSAETARALTAIMESVVEAGGTATLAAIPGISVAGKTGTAEKVDPVTGRYSRELHVSSFIGFAPADKPRVAVVVVIDEPRRAHFGGATAGPVWREIVMRALVDDALLVAEHVADDAKTKAKAEKAKKPMPKGETVPASPFIGLTAREALVRASSEGQVVRFEGSGVVHEVRVEDEGLLLSLGERAPRTEAMR